MIFRACLITLMAFMVCLATVPSAARGQKEEPPVDPFSTHKAGELVAGKPLTKPQICVISTKLAYAGAILEKTSIVPLGLGKKEFIQGTVPAGLPAPWSQSAGQPILVALDEVTQIVLYDDIEKLKAALKLCTKPCP